MKTAMQELIEHLNNVKEFNTMIPGIIKGAEKLLEKEKEQIMDAYNQGTLDGESGIIFYPDYYFKTYNQNK